MKKIEQAILFIKTLFYTFGDLKCRFFSKKNKQKFDFEVSKNNLYTTFYPLFKRGGDTFNTIIYLLPKSFLNINKHLEKTINQNIGVIKINYVLF